MPELTFGEQRSPAMKKIDKRVKDRVQKGIDLLQEKHGADWVDKIDLKSLNLGSTTECVLGQVYGDYHDGLKELQLHGESAKYGFMSEGEPYTVLDEEWADRISLLRGRQHPKELLNG